jgi:hypothetical protein
VTPPTDADIEHLRRAMVEAWQTNASLHAAMVIDATWIGVHGARENAQREFLDAARAYVAAKRARGGA